MTTATCMHTLVRFISSTDVEDFEDSYWLCVLKRGKSGWSEGFFIRFTSSKLDVSNSVILEVDFLMAFLGGPKPLSSFLWLPSGIFFDLYLVTSNWWKALGLLKDINGYKCPIINKWKIFVSVNILFSTINGGFFD